jgi:hypothetical protein
MSGVSTAHKILSTIYDERLLKTLHDIYSDGFLAKRTWLERGLQHDFYWDLAGCSWQITITALLVFVFYRLRNSN